ncbi:MAG: spore coat protein U domain-containing protein [Myxococcales bacterium]|nr:spore coat protein U domain-containing protein [Myxococcales bacterium]USN50722.1 MAG: spore coat protein U domain-containing protein [Myxococcales bacterium]
MLRAHSNIIFISIIILLSSKVVFSTCNGTAPCTCTIATTNMPFGNYQFSTASPTDSQATVTVSCSSGGLSDLSASYTISGGFDGNPPTQRYMSGPSSSQLLYNLYTDINHTNIFGDGLNGTSTVSGSCSQTCPIIIVCGPRSCSSDHIIYGRIPASQTVTAGSYSQTIQVTVTF